MVTRMTGLMSNLDTASLVEQMMLGSQTKYNNMYKKKTEAEWKKTLYNDIYAQMKELREKLFDYSLSGKTATKTATISNDSVASVSASTTASNASHTLLVKQLAAAGSVASSEKISIGDKNTLASQFGIASDTDLTFELNGKTINLSSNQSISTLVSRINSSGAGVTASYDTNMDRLFITTTSTGEAAEIGFTASGAAADFLDKLKLISSEKDNAGNNIRIGAGDTAKGKDAIFELDGIELNQSSNDFSISGITYSLKSTSDSPTLVSVKTDNSAILENVKSLIETYNNLLSVINSTVSEKYNRDYGPLNDEQKAEMTEKEIELWEAKAKSGILRNDTVLKSLGSKMRTTMYGVSKSVNGNYNSLSKLGISTTDYSDQGKLTIDEDKFLKALADDPDAVSKLFSAEDGFVNQLRTNLQTAMTDLENKAGAGKKVDSSSTLYKQIYKLDKQMDSLADKMVTEENNYYKIFTNLETALSKLNSQSNYITSMLGG